MAAVPVKPQYGPTLGRLLSPRWHAASPLARGVLVAGGVAVVVVLAAAALALVNPTYSRGGRVAFHFSYRDLYRTAPRAGELVRVQRLRANGRVRDSFAVAPLRLPPYSGELSAELPLYSAGLIEQLSRRYQRFRAARRGQEHGQQRARVQRLLQRAQRRPDDVRTRGPAAARRARRARRHGQSRC